MIKFLVGIFIVVFIGCGGKKTTPTPPVNLSPVATIVASSVNVKSGESILLDGSSSKDNDGTIVKYEWLNQQGGRIGTQSKLTWIAPGQVGKYTLQLVVTDDDNATGKNTIVIDVTKPVVVDNSFAAVKNLIASGNATYFCVGDSTRASEASVYYNPNSTYHSEFVYPVIKNALDDYNVTSYLYARQGHEAKQFNLETEHPTWRDVVNQAPGNGSTTIVDISLGINDLFSQANNYDGTVADIKRDLQEAIAKIRQQKPSILIVLTMPNPKDPAQADAVIQSNILKTAYLELSSELNLPLIDVMGELNFTHDMYKIDLVHFHLIQAAQVQVGELVKEKILP